MLEFISDVNNRVRIFAERNFGMPEQEIRIDMQLDKLAQLKIALNIMVGSVQNELRGVVSRKIVYLKDVAALRRYGKPHNPVEQTPLWLVRAAMKDNVNIPTVRDEYLSVLGNSPKACLLRSFFQKETLKT